MRKKVTIIGGGTGTMAVLSGLKNYPDVQLSVIVSMTDDGGSNAVIRDEFGFLPLGDLRKSIIALGGDNTELLRDVFTYRFDKGDGLAGHTLGSLIMMGLSEMKGSELAAVEAASTLFQVKGRVIPVTLDHVRLVAQYDDGGVVKSEHLIDEPLDGSDRRIVHLTLEPAGVVYTDARMAIEGADIIIAGPGDLYTTTLANIIVAGVPEAIQKNKGKFVFVSNLMTKTGQTHDMKTGDLVREIFRYAGRKPDVVVVHRGNLPTPILDIYAAQGEFPIPDDLSNNGSTQVVRADMVSDIPVTSDAGDVLRRSLIRHDAGKLGKILYDICFSSL